MVAGVRVLSWTKVSSAGPVGGGSPGAATLTQISAPMVPLGLARRAGGTESQAPVLQFYILDSDPIPDALSTTN